MTDKRRAFESTTKERCEERWSEGSSSKTSKPSPEQTFGFWSDGGQVWN